MSRTLPQVIADILSYKGAVVERREPDGLEVVVPGKVAEILKIPEYAKLKFSYGEDEEDSRAATYESDFFHAIINLFSGSGRWSQAYFEPYVPNVEKLTRALNEKLGLSNATFRLEKTETLDLSYLLFCFKYVALSDEKHEGIIPLLLNELNYSFSSSDNYLEDIIPQLKEHQSKRPASSPEFLKHLQAAHAASSHMAKDKLRDFIKSLERRLNRDIKRVYDYYDTLKKEVKADITRRAFSAEEATSIAPFIKKTHKESDAGADKTDQMMDEITSHFHNSRELINEQIDNRTIKGEGIDRLLSKLEAIEAEQQWKIQDLTAKYALNIRTEPVTAISIETQGPVFWINIKRRLTTRRFPVTYNPILKQLDSFPCEACFYPQGSSYLCDDKLHLVCARCFKMCPHCGKPFCRACYGTVCPKCKKENES